MYRTVEDFIQDWSAATAGTNQVLEAMTDETLSQSIVEGHSSLGWLGWHLANSPVSFASLVGVSVAPASDSQDVPTSAADILNAYKQVGERVKSRVEETLTDEMMVEEVEAMGRKVPRGALLRLLIDHQTHHRGQMTVLLRQAGLPVPGIMGPTQEAQNQ
ncbi:DinB family protein [Halalkalibacter sp. APA_J-10(15)]|uniref:DinB family protein n=1 Tax=unclassified Halalkalibacter TaxID=2893063 RepID=UPI001FF6ED5F|nr:DinB family protein [Halalkalibacter sp. APA_J-10(15)]MCK0473192.1 DinB family protein [Halalkalibacter sp. APA_J-10(15)]